MKTTQPSHKQRQELYRQNKIGPMSRREFMRTITLLGASFGAATIAAQCSPSTSGGVPPASNTELPSAQEQVSVEKALVEQAPATTAEVVDTAGQLEILSAFTGGSEGAALEVLHDIYGREYPKVEIINAFVSGDSTDPLNEVLEIRLQGNRPPDIFQVHLGHELTDAYVVAGYIEPLDFLYEEEGWNDVFPPDLLTIGSWDGHPWSVPVNIHRSNVLWWNPRLFQEAGIDAPPETFDEFFTAAARLKDAGFDGIIMSGPRGTAHVFEGILAGFLTPDQYRGLWTGDTDWSSSEVEAALMFLKETLENFANEDFLSIGWGDGRKRFEEGTTGMMIMGDWQNGDFKNAGFTDYAWAPVMGTKGVFVVLSDSFGLPKGAPHRENALNWLRVIGSKEGQEQFNIIKGSIPARTDVDVSKFDAYQQSAIADFKVNELVPSVVHGAAANNEWAGEYVMALNTFANNKDINQARENLVRACEEVGLCNAAS